MFSFSRLHFFPLSKTNNAKNFASIPHYTITRPICFHVPPHMNLLFIDDNETVVGVDSESPTKVPKDSIASGSKLTCEDITVK